MTIFNSKIFISEFYVHNFIKIFPPLYPKKNYIIFIIIYKNKHYKHDVNVDLIKRHI